MGQNRSGQAVLVFSSYRVDTTRLTLPKIRHICVCFPHTVKTLLKSNELIGLLEQENERLAKLRAEQMTHAEIEIRLAMLTKNLSWLDRALPFRAASKAKLNSIYDQQAKLDHHQELIERESRHLKPISENIRRSLTIELATNSKRYKSGMELRSDQKELLNSLPELESQIRGLVRALGSARSAMVAGYDQKCKAYSKAAHQEFDACLPVSANLRLSLIGLSSICERHNARAKEQALGRIQLPLLPTKDYRSELKQLPSQPIGLAHQSIEGIVSELESLASGDLASMKQEIEHVYVQTERFLGELVSIRHEELRKQLQRSAQ